MNIKTKSILKFFILLLFCKVNVLAAQEFPNDSFKVNFAEGKFVFKLEEGVRTYKCKINNSIYRVNVNIQGSITNDIKFQNDFFNEARQHCVKNGFKYSKFVFCGVNAIEFSQHVSNGTIIKMLMFIANQRIYSLMQTSIGEQNDYLWSGFKRSFTLMKY